MGFSAARLTLIAGHLPLNTVIKVYFIIIIIIITPVFISGIIVIVIIVSTTSPPPSIITIHITSYIISALSHATFAESWKARSLQRALTVCPHNLSGNPFRANFAVRNNGDHGI